LRALDALLAGTPYAAFDADANALIAVCRGFNADITDVPMTAIRGDVADTGNADLSRTGSSLRASAASSRRRGSRSTTMGVAR
jgi:hypothetical protein